MNGAVWTEADLAALRAHYASATRDEMVAMFPGRSWNAIQQRASILGLKTARWWSPEEDAELRDLWPETARRTIVTRFGRSWNAIVSHARALGLEGRWSGYVTLTEAARRTGYEYRGLLRVLDAYRAHWATLPLIEREALASAAPIRRGAYFGKRLHRVVDAQGVVDAVEWWMSCESRPQAAERLGVPYTTLVSMLLRAGESVGKRDRRPAAWWDALVRSQARRGPRVVRCVPRAQVEQRSAA